MDFQADEYKIAQDKIDKIGSIRMIIRGWAVTAVIGGILAATFKELPRQLVADTLGGAVIFFFWFECEQVMISRKLGNRARVIELQWELHNISNNIPQEAPMVARTLSTQSANWYPLKWYRDAKFKSRDAIYWRSLLLRLWSIAKQAHGLFYLLLFILAMTVGLKKTPPTQTSNTDASTVVNSLTQISNDCSLESSKSTAASEHSRAHRSVPSVKRAIPACLKEKNDQASR